MPELRNRFSAPANRVFSKIQSEVQRLNHTRIEPEHVMLVLMHEESGSAYKALQEMGVDLAELEGLLLTSLNQIDFPESDLTMSDETKRILGLSMDAVATLERPYLGTEHLLVALMRDLSNRVYPIMRRIGVTYNDMLTSIRKVPFEEVSEAAFKAGEDHQEVQNGEVLGVWGVVRHISVVFWLLLLAVIAAGLAAWWEWINPGLAVFSFVTLGWVISVCLHEFGHALVGYWGGDLGVLQRGYLTLNPIKYTHGVVSILLPVLFLALGGIGLPGGAVYINQAAIPDRRTRSSLSAAGPMVTGMLTLLLAMPFATDWFVNTANQHQAFWAGLSFLVFVQVWALVFNLLPLPPLDGFGIISPYLSEELRQKLSRLAGWTLFIIIMLFIIDTPVQHLFWQLIGQILSLLGVDFDLLNLGMDLYRFW
jgi:Zn-dependent protease